MTKYCLLIKYTRSISIFTVAHIGKGNNQWVITSAKRKDLDNVNTTADFWADHKWNTEWQKNTSRLHTFIPSSGPSPPRMTLPGPYWVRLNRLRTGVGLFRSTMHKWGLVPSVNCRCGAEEQTADHILVSCPLYHPSLPSNETLSLAALDDDTADWLKNKALKIRWQDRPKRRRIRTSAKMHFNDLTNLVLVL